MWGIERKGEDWLGEVEQRKKRHKEKVSRIEEKEEQRLKKERRGGSG